MQPPAAQFHSPSQNPASSSGPSRSNSVASESQQLPANWPSGVNLAGLPPLPPGLAIAHLAQYGSVGLEMAIRMGMGIGMGLGQQAVQQQLQSPGQPQSDAHEPWQQTMPVASDTSLPVANHQAPKKDVVGDILKDDFLSGRLPGTPFSSDLPISPSFSGLGRFPSSRRPSQSEATSPLDGSPADLAKKDPLASQVWKIYAKARDTMPNGHRMENLTWRMMHLTLKKQEEEEAAKKAAEAISTAQASQKSNSTALPVEGQQRGRSQGKSRVVGFQKADSPEEE